MSTGITDLADLAQDLLDGIVAELLADGMAADVIPDRRYLTFGTPVGECGALVVSMERVFGGVPGVAESPEVLRANVVRSAVLSVWLFRCLSAVTQGEGIEAQTAPSPDALTADARLVMTDTYLLHRAVGKARKAGLFHDFKLTASVGPALPVQPQGGIGGVTVAVTVELSQMATNVRVDAAKVAAFMRSPGGPVMRRMLLVGDKVKAVAVEELKDGFPRDFLGPQIVKRMQVVDSGPYAGPHVFVGAQHTVTRPHPIEGNPLLYFFSKTHMHLISVHHVNHPGSNLGPYLERTLLKALEKVRGAV